MLRAPAGGAGAGRAHAGARAGGARRGARRRMRITWLMRTTLHLVHADDLEWLHPLFAPRMEAANVRRLKQLGVTEAQAERAVELIAARVPAKRAELAEHLGGARHPGRGSGDRPPARPRGDAGPRRAHAGARLRRRSTLPAAPDRDAALDELARRYYACHAGATADDLAYWSGLPKRDCRQPGPTPVDDGPVPRVSFPPSTSSCSAGATAPRPSRPSTPARPPGRRHPPPGDPRERRRRRHLDVARRVPFPAFNLKGTVPYVSAAG